MLVAELADVFSCFVTVHYLLLKVRGVWYMTHDFSG